MTGENVDIVTIKNENTYQRRVQQLNKILNCGLKAKERLFYLHMMTINEKMRQLINLKIILFEVSNRFSISLT